MRARLVHRVIWARLVLIARWLDRRVTLAQLEPRASRGQRVPTALSQGQLERLVHRVKPVLTVPAWSYWAAWPTVRRYPVTQHHILAT
jgi:hypothetical protein